MPVYLLGTRETAINQRLDAKHARHSQELQMRFRVQEASQFSLATLHRRRMHPKSVAQRYKMRDDLAKTFEVCLEVLPKIMRVPPKVIAFPVPRSCRHASLDRGYMHGMNCCQTTRTRPQEATGGNIRWLPSTNLKGL
jgi:hypothetical protein